MAWIAIFSFLTLVIIAHILAIDTPHRDFDEDVLTAASLEAASRRVERHEQKRLAGSTIEVGAGYQVPAR